ncbi:flagellar filament capping protein FliD [Patulibacter sp. SYSU D01012]|uniref:flagellar filament capping protein FliD n=1 Tax=Patulibacter sp. SYSU D01012 TaxID=2817381 RepID=UPI001B305406|nr:flagellar filament capping protein FliD [Patulibacter sp. SYSU D01012]
MGISLSGLATSLDTDALITQLMATEKQPLTRMNQQQADQKSAKATIQSVVDKLKSLQTAANALRDPTLFGNKQSVSVGDASAATATVQSGAATGGYQLVVDRLARSASASYAYTPQSTAGTITVAGSGWSDTIATNPDEIMSDFVARINGNASLHVVASVTTVAGQERIAFASRATGATSGFSASGAELSDEQLKAGQDARVLVDGQEHLSRTNVFDDAIPGVRLTLRGVTSTPTTVNVGAPGADADGVAKAAKTFVDAYNAAVDLLRTTTAVVAGKTNALGGDIGLTSIQDRLRQSLVETTNGVTGLPLEKLGISTGKTSGTSKTSTDALQGRLTLDETVLKDAVTKDPGAVRTTLARSGGVLNAIADNVTSWTAATSGTLTQRMSIIDQFVSDLNVRMDQFNARMDARQTALKAQFARLEATISGFNDQKSWLTGQLSALNK